MKESYISKVNKGSSKESKYCLITSTTTLGLIFKESPIFSFFFIKQKF